MICFLFIRIFSSYKNIRYCQTCCWQNVSGNTELCVGGFEVFEGKQIVYGLKASHCFYFFAKGLILARSEFQYKQRNNLETTQELFNFFISSFSSYFVQIELNNYLNVFGVSHQHHYHDRCIACKSKSNYDVQC